MVQGFTEELRQWDVPFWAEKLREAKYDIREEDLRPYFPLEQVLEGLFSVSAFPATFSLSFMSLAHQQGEHYSKA